MKPTAILQSEHRVIEVVLSCLERLVEETKNTSHLDAASATQIVDFIRTFSDRCHHGKEEAHLFTTLVNKGLPADGGPVAQMLHEHKQGRLYVREMADSTAAAADGDDAAMQTFMRAALRYVELLRAHIQKEDQILFPLADSMLSADDQDGLLEQFDAVESEHMESGTHDRYLRLAESLAGRFGVSLKGITETSGGCGH